MCARPGALARVTQTRPPCVAWKLQAPSWADPTARPREPAETLLCLYLCNSDPSPDPASTPKGRVGSRYLGILFL